MSNSESVTVVGEALVDVVRSRDGDATETPGGSPMNVAVGLARLGVPARLVCALGDDVRGALVRAHVERSGVEVLATPIERTSAAVATIDENGSATYEFDLAWRLAPIVLAPATPLLHVGSIGAVLAPGAGAVLDAVRSRPAGALVSLDPNVRPSITPDRDAVHAALEPLFDAADVVKLSDEDADWLWPGRSVDTVLDGLLTHGAALAAVTLGGSGCVIATRDDRRTLAAPPVRVADTIGAGDSFMAGLLAGVLESGADDPETPARLALACAAITVSRPGAAPPTRAELAAAGERTA